MCSIDDFGVALVCHCSMLLILSLSFLLFKSYTRAYASFQALQSHLLQVRGGQLWGTDIYTDDSDLVAGM